MAVQAKFTVDSVVAETYSFGVIHRVNLRPVYGPGNESWSAATPSGQLTMQVSNLAALEQFAPGKIFTLTFEESK